MKKIFATLFLFACVTYGYAQSRRINLEKPVVSTQPNYIASESITLKPGFSSGTSFTAKIDETATLAEDYLPQAISTDPANRPFDTSAPVSLAQGSVNVSPTGAATYHFPINIPAGIAGMQPNISIDYNSQGGDGPLGIGWNISGLSAISRVPRTIFTDGVAGGIHFDANDRFALDGNRLLPLTSSTYETEIQTFSKIEGVGGDVNGPASFKVTTKDGKILFYGNSDDSKVIPVPNPYITPAQAVLPIAWRLNRVEDANGNFMIFTYKKLNGESVIERIDYNGNIENPASNSVQFFYDLKGTPSISYINGASIANNFLLRKIKATIAGTTVRTYNFDYTTQEGKSNLNIISELGADNSEVNSTVINWGKKKDIILASRHTFRDKGNDTSVENKNWTYADYDGDGILDLIATYTIYSTEGTLYLSKGVRSLNGDITFPYSEHHRSPNLINGGPAIVCNLDINKKPDLIVPVTYLAPDHSSAYIKFVHIASGGWKIYQSTIAKENDKAPSYDVADLNNDGFDDILFLESVKTNGKYQGKIKYGSKYGVENDFVDFSFDFGSSKPQKLFIADYDNDGFKDVLVLCDGGYFWIKNLGVTTAVCKGGSYLCEFSYEPLLHNGINALSSKITTGDFNGDGLSDLVFSDSAKQNLQIALSNGAFGFNIKEIAPPLGERWDNVDLSVTDFNHDGKSDLIILENQYTVYESVDDIKYNNTPPIPTTKRYSQAFKSTVIKWYSASRDGYFSEFKSSVVNDLTLYKKLNILGQGDFNGDGYDDFINYGYDLLTGEASVYYYSDHIYSSFNTNYEAGVVTSISDGLKNNTSITYQPISITKKPDGSDFYLKGTSSLYPIVDITAPIYCVNSIVVPDGVGGISKTEYSYAGARLHQTGKGFLGFSKQTAVNVTGDKKLISSTLLDLAKLLPTTQTVEVQTATGTPISTTVNTFDISTIVNGNNNTYKTSLKESQVVDKLTGVTSKTTNTYDDFLNLTQSVVNVGGTDVQTTTYSGHVAVNGSPYISKPTIITTTTKHPDDPNSFISKIEYTYDTKGNVILETKNPGAKQVKTEYIGYDSWGMPKTVKTTSGSFAVTQTKEFSYTNGVITTTTSNANLGDTKTVKDLINRTATTTGTNGLSTTTTFDGLGHEIQTELADKNKVKTKMAFDSNDDNKRALYSVLTETDGRPWVKTYYDSFGRTVQTETVGVNGMAIKSTTLYNAQGKVVKQSSSIGGELKNEVTYTYKPNDGRLESETYNNGRSLSYQYTGLEVKTTDNNNNVTTTVYNSLGKVKKITEPSPGENTPAATIDYAYASCGKPTSITTATSTISMTYDELGNQQSLNDPNAGNHTYEYDGLGRLVSQTDSKNTTTTLTYNSFGQLVNKKSPSLDLTYTYYTDGRSRGQLKNISNGSGIVESFEYDSDFGRLVKTTRKIADLAESVIYENSYDAWGNVNSITYPGNYVVTQTHDNYGNLIKVSDSNTAIWTLTTQDANTLSYTLGNDFVTTKTFDDFGKLTSITSVKGSDYYAQKNIYEYYTENDLLKSRTEECDKLNILKEIFTYDNLERLKTWKTYKNDTLNANYSLGYINDKISSKSDIGYYEYKAGKPHAISSVVSSGIPGFTPTLSDAHTISYNENGKVSSIVQGTKRLDLTYGYNDQREKTILTENGVATTTYFAGSYEVKLTADGTKKEYLYIGGGDGVAAVLIKTNGNAGELFYLHKDNLGSIIALTDKNGAKREQMSYDAWGRRRNPTDWSFNNSSVQIIPTILTRGYTGHEHLDAFALINMNGRIYDPLLGTFISCDNFIQAPSYSQSFNRYSYCMGNPLKYTDPSGQKWYKWLNPFQPFIALMDWINGSTTELRTKMTNANIPDFNVGATAYGNGSMSYSAGNGSYAVGYHSEYGWGGGTPNNIIYPRNTSKSEQFVVDGINSARGEEFRNCQNEIVLSNTAGQGRDYFGTANNWLNGAGYLSGGIGAYQIGMLDYRSSLSLSSKIGTFSKFSSTYRLLGTTGKVLGGASTYVGAPLSIGLDYSAMQNGQISGDLFAYRTTGTLSSIGGGALIGSAYGGPWGAAGGALIGAGFVAGEYIYNGAQHIWNETLWQISNFENAIKSGWYPGR